MPITAAVTGIDDGVAQTPGSPRSLTITHRVLGADYHRMNLNLPATVTDTPLHKLSQMWPDARSLARSRTVWLG